MYGGGGAVVVVVVVILEREWERTKRLQVYMYKDKGQPTL